MSERYFYNVVVDGTRKILSVGHATHFAIAKAMEEAMRRRRRHSKGWRKHIRHSKGWRKHIRRMKARDQ